MDADQIPDNNEISLNDDRTDTKGKGKASSGTVASNDVANTTKNLSQEDLAEINPHSDAAAKQRVYNSQPVASSSSTIPEKGKGIMQPQFEGDRIDKIRAEMNATKAAAEAAEAKAQSVEPHKPSKIRFGGVSSAPINEPAPSKPAFGRFGSFKPAFTSLDPIVPESKPGKTPMFSVPDSDTSSDSSSRRSPILDHVMSHNPFLNTTPPATPEETGRLLPKTGSEDEITGHTTPISSSQSSIASNSSSNSDSTIKDSLPLKSA